MSGTVSVAFRTFAGTSDNVQTSYGDCVYRVDYPDQTLAIRIILSDTLVHMVSYDSFTNASSEMTMTIVPYVFICICTSDVVGEAFDDFELFVANTRTTDEFVLMNEMESQMLYSIVTNGWSQYEEDSLWESLGTGDRRPQSDSLHGRRMTAARALIPSTTMFHVHKSFYNIVTYIDPV